MCSEWLCDRPCFPGWNGKGRLGKSSHPCRFQSPLDTCSFRWHPLPRFHQTLAHIQQTNLGVINGRTIIGAVIQHGGNLDVGPDGFRTSHRCRPNWRPAGWLLFRVRQLKAAAAPAGPLPPAPTGAISHLVDGDEGLVDLDDVRPTLVEITVAGIPSKLRSSPSWESFTFKIPQAVGRSSGWCNCRVTYQSRSKPTTRYPSGASTVLLGKAKLTASPSELPGD